MFVRNTFIKIIFLLLLITTQVVHGELPKNKMQNNMLIEIINKHSMKKLLLPFHDFEYEIILSNEEESSGDYLKGVVSDKPINVMVHRYDKNNIIADLVVIDPAMGKRIIWDGQIIFDKSTNQPKMITRKQNDYYAIDFKLSLPNEKAKFEIDIVSL